ncbi:tyrosine-type recombinase/integrase [Pseudomonas monteilii]
MSLTQKVIQNITTPGKYQDKYGLALRVSPGGSKAWILRYTFNGVRRDDGLGKYPDVSLAEARETAMAMRLKAGKGIDPRQEKAERAKAATTFEEAGNAFIARHRHGWSEAHIHQWEASLRDHVYPKIGRTPVHAIDTETVRTVLDVIWHEKPETARRVRNRIERILDYSKALGHREGDNPARWRGHLQNIMSTLLPTPTPLESMDYRVLPAFMRRLDAEDSRAARCLQFLILTGCRSKEAMDARWDEIDWERLVWRIPAERMKSRELHEIPLSDAALAVLKEAGTRGRSDYIFASKNLKAPMANNSLRRLMTKLGEDCTVHGFRATFRTWLQEKTDFSNELCEAALAHAVGTLTQRAYTRGKQLEKRRPMMDKWARFAVEKLVTPTPRPTVNSMAAARTPRIKSECTVRP